MTSQSIFPLGSAPPFSRLPVFRVTLLRMVLGILITGNSSLASASVQYYRLFKSQSYQQTTNAPPSVPNLIWASVDVLSTSAADFTSAQVTTTSPLSPITLAPFAPSYAPPFFAFVRQQSYGTLSDLSTDFPNGTLYQYGVSGGTLGAQSGSLSTPATDRFASQVPYFNGTVFSQLQGMNSAAPFQFTWNGYVAAAGINAPFIYFAINRVSNGQLVFGTTGTNALTSVALPTNTLQPGTAYDVSLVYSSRIDTPNAGFSGATSEVGFDLRTDLIFTTASVPEPGTLALGIVGVAFLTFVAYVRRRRVP